MHPDAAVDEGATEKHHSCVTPVSFSNLSAKQTGTETSEELASLSPMPGSPGTPVSLRDSLDPLTLETAPVPEPLGKEVILGSHQDLTSARRKHFPPKAIQIIDPRPLPPRKTLMNPSEVPNALTSPHLYASVSSDHDYCAPAARLPTSKESAPVEGSLPKTQDSECNEVNTSVNHSVSVETAAPADTLLSILHQVDTQRTCKSAADHQVAPCVVPSPPARGRGRRRRYRRRSPCSDSSSSSYSSSSASSSSCSPSPKRQVSHSKCQCVGGGVPVVQDVHLYDFTLFYFAGGGTDIQRAVPVPLRLPAPCLSPHHRATGGPAPEKDAAGPDPALGPGPPPDPDRHLPTISTTSGETFTSQLKMQVLRNGVNTLVLSCAQLIFPFNWPTLQQQKVEEDEKRT